jgi:hypothetical protein
MRGRSGANSGPYGPSREIRKQIARLDGKGSRQFDDVFQSNIPLAALNPTHVIAMQAGPFGQFLLRVAPLIAELP